MDCEITLGFLSTYTNTIIPAIYAENCDLVISSVKIKGNNEFLTVGVLANFSDIEIRNSKIVNQRCGGVLVRCQEGNIVKVRNNDLLENMGCGVFTKGNGEVSINNNNLFKNEGVGIKVLDCQRLTCLSNRVSDNLLNGGEFINCEGLILLNQFMNNKACGSILRSQGNERFAAKFMKNIVTDNFESGISVEGENNFAKIYENEKIANNNMVGIIVKDKAYPNIFENNIYENMQQGILIVSGSAAAVKRNLIHHNIKANIAFGGEMSEMTIIDDNKIYASRSEGIFAMKASEQSLIMNNEIFDNNDGLIFIESDSNVQENSIYNNMRIGLLLSKGSRPKVKDNNISNNQFLGVFVREKSFAKFYDNVIVNNISQLFLSSDCSSMHTIIKKNNKIEGRTDVESRCSIF